jgi:nucleotide-binding universal stress UspA family protein
LTLGQSLSKTLENVSKNTLSKSRGIGKKNGVSIEIELRKCDPASNIIDYCKKENFDTVIMGRRGMGKLKQLVLGSTSTKVLNHSDCTARNIK